MPRAEKDSVDVLPRNNSREEGKGGEEEEEEEEEKECRVCRGPAEEGRELFAPCKCSGSIGLTHQDCLTSWLTVTRGDGRCELCGTKFQFAPKYAQGTPDRLPFHEVVLGFSRSIVAKWMPFLLRIAVCLFLWLVVIPLLTAYSYHAWVHKPSSVMTRLKWELVSGDIISGAVVVAVIIISFLGFMSFFDFLRLHWGNPQNNNNRNNEEQHQNIQEVDPADIPDEDVDDVVLDHNHLLRRQPNRSLHAVGVMDQRQPVFAAGRGRPAFERLLQDMPNEPAAQREELQLRIQAAAALQQQLNALEATVAAREQGMRGKEETQDNGEGQFQVLRDQTFKDEDENENDGQCCLQQQKIENNSEPHSPWSLRQQEGNYEEEKGSDLAPTLIPDNAFPDNDDRLTNNNLDLQHALLVAQDQSVEEHKIEEDERKETDDEDEENTPYDGQPQDNEDDAEARLERFLMEQEDDDDDHNFDPPLVPEIPPPNNNDRFEPQFEPLDPVMNNQEDPLDAEMNVAIDELFGLRGPFGALVRNLLWLLAFNMVYLLVFACIPSSIGSAVGFTTYYLFLNSTNITGRPAVLNVALDAVEILNNESQRLNTTFLLPDLAAVALGYFAIAVFTLILQWLLKRYYQLVGPQETVAGAEEGRQELEGDLPRLPQAQLDPDPEEPLIQFHDGAIAIQGTVSTLMDGVAAVVKVCVLLFLKMLLLPLLLGIWLDIATLSAFNKSIRDRVLFAGGDLFSSLLVHWVVGITFMLLVTVSVLQLREVIHPSLLARVIRPQEPQPDLLGNLFNESGSTHAKRMFLSFAIYAALLTVHVWLPAQLLASSGVAPLLPFLRPQIYHILSSQLQIPLELLIFHLTMLGFLEKYKNNIGAIQHSWLAFISRQFGLADHLLPHSISRLRLVGSKPIFGSHSDPSEHDLLHDDAATDGTPGLTSLTVVTSRSEGATTAASEAPASPVQSSMVSARWTSSPMTPENLGDMNQVDPFWYELAYKKGSKAEDFILKSMEKTTEVKFETHKEKENGQCVLFNCRDYIRLPLPSSEQDVVDRRKRRSGSAQRRASERKNVICTIQGRYRLRRAVRGDGVMIIEFWQECAGDLIARPPEGWDDLREGGAEVQGRWAWGKEKKSKIEEGVACRKPFFASSIPTPSSAVLLTSTALLLLLSWLAIIAFTCVALSVPLLVGRYILTALRVSSDRMHDPLAFAIGVFLVGPAVTAVARKLNERPGNSIGRIKSWFGRFKFPPRTKTVVFGASIFCWFVVSPLLLGILYDQMFVKTSDDIGDEENTNHDGLLDFWQSGLVLLHAWAFMCYVRAFGKQFWVDLGNAIVFVDEEEDNQIDDGPRNRRQHDVSDDEGSWQGEHGKIGQLLNVFRRAVADWEWDTIDPTQLKESLLPIVFHLSCAIILPGAAYGCWRFSRTALGFSETGMVIPLVGTITEGSCRLLVYRLLILCSIILQFALVFRSELRGWFEIVHKAARDDRYLVGQILLDWSAETKRASG